jgi:AbrB family transcriptional regulator (stage V sporulation protein T)
MMTKSFFKEEGRKVKATGIVRRIDDLGRVVIPKEIRRTLKIREGDPLEIFVDRDGEVILKKYSPIGELADFAQEYADSLNESTGHIACISDKDIIVAVSGAPRKEFFEKRISSLVERAINERRTILLKGTEKDESGEGFRVIADDPEEKYAAGVIVPIVSEGVAIGTVIISTRDTSKAVGELETKLAETAAAFLARQMEQ